jgi:glycosyltransferase involved in cell wall biosynthesis
VKLPEVEAARKTVSVIIPVFNGQHTIAAAIDSALAQEFDGVLEVVVIDDGSTDATGAVLEAYRGRVRVLERENRGEGAARNAGIRESHGEYIAFLDADDIWRPDKLEKTVAALDRAGAASMVYSDADKIDASGRRLGLTYTPELQKRAPTLEDLLSEPWNILPSTMVMTRVAFDQAGGFEEGFGTYPKWQDTWFTLLARAVGAFVYLDESLVLYRVATSFAGDLERHQVRRQCDLDPRLAQIEEFIHCSETIQRLVRERFASRAAGLLTAIRSTAVNMLVGIGLSAMVAGDRRFARRAYVRALRYGPLNPKTYLRLVWTYLPERVARAISATLPPRLRRVVSGPAQT